MYLGPHKLRGLQALQVEALRLGRAENEGLAVLSHVLHTVPGEHMVLREGAALRFDHLDTKRKSDEPPSGRRGRVPRDRTKPARAAVARWSRSSRARIRGAPGPRITRSSPPSHHGAWKKMLRLSGVFSSLIEEIGSLFFLILSIFPPQIKTNTENPLLLLF